VLAILMGFISGRIAVWGASLPITSFRGLFGLLTLTALMQTESTMGVILSSWFQGTMALVGVRLLFMRSLSGPVRETSPRPVVTSALRPRRTIPSPTS